MYILHFHESVQLERDWKTARWWEYLPSTLRMGRNTKVGKSLVSIKNIKKNDRMKISTNPEFHSMYINLSRFRGDMFKVYQYPKYCCYVKGTQYRSPLH